MIKVIQDLWTDWEEEPLESSLAEEDLDVLINERLNMRQQYKLPGQKASWDASTEEWQQGTVALCSSLMRPHLQYDIQV